MVAIAGGLAAACCWAFATLASSRSSRMVGAVSVIGWVMLVGLAVIVVPAAVTVPVLDPLRAVGLVIVGVSYTAGLLLTYAALTIGRVSIVAPICATEGAISATISIALGEPLGAGTAIVLAAIAIGVVMAAFERSADVEQAAPALDPRHQRRAALLALASAGTFSIGLVAAGRLGQAGIPPTWVVLVPRIIGVLAITLPLLATRRLRLTRAAAPLVVFSGLLEAFGNASYVVAARDGVAPAAVLSSQFAAIAAVGAFVLFGERLQRVQVAGVAIIAVGVAVLAASTAG